MRKDLSVESVLYWVMISPPEMFKDSFISWYMDGYK